MLQDRQPLAEALVELVDEFRTVCLGHLSVADREVLKLARRLRGLSATRAGGKS
jgi:hypothetical protein